VSSFPRPERIAAAARALGPELSERVTLYADALADSLERELELVPWDREQLVGGVQNRLEQLRQQRYRDYGGAGVRVIERRRQPLESVDLGWSELRQGRPVFIEYERRACSAVAEMMRGMSRRINSVVEAPVLVVADEPLSSSPPDPSASSVAFAKVGESVLTPTMWPVIGPTRPGPRVAVIEENADRELAAYVLARTSLRRTGMDPRGVRQAFVVGPTELLYRHAQRLWVEVRMGPAREHGSFAGPVPRRVFKEFVEAHEAWSLHPDVEVLCTGGPLELAGEDGHYLAPALFSTSWPGPDLPVAGPMLVITQCSSEQARAAAEAAVREGGQIIAIGGRPKQYPAQALKGGDVRLVRGALLVERLPPGMPDPRPV
jgi:hypothetical protein